MEKNTILLVEDDYALAMGTEYTEQRTMRYAMQRTLQRRGELLVWMRR